MSSPPRTGSKARPSASASARSSEQRYMNDDRQLILPFNNRTKMEMSFPTQTGNSTPAVLETKKGLEADKLVIEGEGRLIVIPWTSVKHIGPTDRKSTRLNSSHL